jgi:hypothetical protein
MENLVLKMLIKEAAAEKLLEELLKIAVEKSNLPWQYRHPILASTGALTMMGLLSTTPFAIERLIAKQPRSALALLGGGLLAGAILGGLRGWLISRELRRYKRMKELGMM